jgi:hypothetical protein
MTTIGDVIRQVETALYDANYPPTPEETETLNRVFYQVSTGNPACRGADTGRRIRSVREPCFFPGYGCPVSHGIHSSTRSPSETGWILRRNRAVSRVLGRTGWSLKNLLYRNRHE